MPGRYLTHKIIGTPGNTYALTVLLNGKTYTAQSTMPKPVILDSVTIDYSDGSNITPMVNFQDPPDAVNYYKLNTTRNGIPANRLQTEYDQLSNGRYIRTHVDQDTGTVKHNDRIRIDLVGIDHPVYQFLRQAEQVVYNNANLASPATPTSNITGGCIGYFSAQTVSSKTAVVK